jgi:large subunit ribosomal protein L3
MAGRMGGDKITIKNVEVIKIDPENNLLVVKGTVPGANQGIVYIKKQ